MKYLIILISGFLSIGVFGQVDIPPIVDNINLKGRGTIESPITLDLTGDIGLWEKVGDDIVKKLKGSGGVGINRTSAFSSLDVQAETGSSEIAWFRSQTGARMFRFQESSNNAYLDFYNSSDQVTMRISTAGTTWFNSGSVAIGATTTTHLFEVHGSTWLTAALYDSNNESGTSGQIFSSTGSGTDWVDFVNLYTSNGTLTGNRTISMGTNNLTFQGIDGSNINNSSFDNNINLFAITDGTNTSNLEQRATHIEISNAPLKLINTSFDQLIITDNETNVTTKNGAIGLMHYTNAEEPVSYFYGQSGSSFSNLRIGGGSSDGNAVTSIRFYTASNTTTTTGTNQMEITDTEIIIHSDLVIDETNDVRIVVGTGSPEGAVTAGKGSTYHNISGGAGTGFYVKETGTGSTDTGWVGK